MACFEDALLLQHVYIQSYSCIRKLSSGFLQLRKLQEVCVPEAGPP